MKEENKRKGIIYLTIGVVTLLVLVAGATYAYFQAQVGDGTSFDVNATTGTTDVLSFLMSDIDISTDYIVDNHNKDSENENEEIVINASQDNFGEKDKSLGDGVSAKAILKANNTNNTASATYNVFFVMEESENNLIYTIDEDHPELIMTVIGPDNREITQIDGLNYHNKDENNPNDVSGFDITGRSGAFAIKTKQEIKVEKNNGNHQTEQEWQIKVTLVNLKENQNENTGKEITGEVVITQEDKDTYKLNHINKVSSESTEESITTTLELAEGATNKAVEYYFGIEEVGEAETISVEDFDDYELSESETYTFKGLKSNTNYRIYSYVVDSEGFKSNIYETELVATKYKIPEIKNIEITEISYDKISIKVTGEKGSKEIKEYEYTIEGGTLDSAKVEKNPSNIHTFSGLSELQQYTIKIKAIDEIGRESTVYEPEEITTIMMPLNIKCQNEEIANCIKDNYYRDETIIYHNLADATTKQFTNYSLVADDNSYRYSGASEIVHNYVCFGADECNETTNYNNLYRIIGVFKNEKTKEYEVKLIKADYALATETGKNGAYYNTINNGYNYETEYLNYYKGNINVNEIGSYFWAGSDIPYNTWSGSLLNTENLNKEFYNNIPDKYQKMINNHTWIVSGNNGDDFIYDTNDANALNVYNIELGKNKIKAGDGGCFDNTIPRNCTEEDLTYPYEGMDASTQVTKIGLMYMSDYYYSMSNKYWHLPGFGGDDYYSYHNNENWLYMGISEWSITRLSNSYINVMIVSRVGYPYYHMYITSVSNAVRPTFYLNSNVKLSSGEGTISSPYRLSM